MTAQWKADLERALMSGGSPSVFSTAMLHALATTGRDDAPSAATFSRWMASMADLGKLEEVIKGVYLNRLGHRNISPAAAAQWVRHRSVVSLSWVLEQAHVTNNYGDTITCVIPTAPGWPTPNVGDRLTKAGTFRFFAMPLRLVDSGRDEDARDRRFDYPRVTPEKALLDWLFLGASHRSRLTRPPFDLDIAALNQPRLRRLAKAMALGTVLDDWMRAYDAYQSNEDVRENSAVRIRL
jgi:hypothetical protein